MPFEKTAGPARSFALYIPNAGLGLAPAGPTQGSALPWWKCEKPAAGSGAGVSPAVARASCPRTFAPRLRSPWTSIADVRLSFRHAGARRSRHSGRDARATRPDLAILCFLPLALALLLLPSCSKKSPEGEGEGTEEGAANIVAEVTVTRLGRSDIESTLSVSGTVSALPNQDVRVSSLVPGRVARMMVAEGDHIREGQVLAKIDDRPFRDQVQQAQAAVDQAKANLENSSLNLQRNERLLERGIAARKDVEDARTQASVNKAALSQAEAALSLVRLNLARTEVRSPLTAMIVKRLLSVGEQVDGTAAQPVFEVASTSEVELFGNVPALYLDKIRLGQTLEISTEAFPGKTFQSHVVAISPAVDPATNVGLVRIRMANGAGLLRLGMFLTAQVPLETHRNALVAPLEAVYRDQDGNPEIYRVQGEKAEAVPVKLGLETKDRIELLSGAQEGETIILGGGYGLPAQAKIKVKS